MKNDYSLPQIDAENYIVTECIGEGGYGIVYKAKHINTGQNVAIKMLKLQNVDPSLKKQQIARFERETRLSAEINHPNIVKLIDKGISSNHEPFAVFEFIEGQTLKDLISIQGGLPPIQVGEIMGQVLDALICAHSKEIAHRDLKPQNIMITKVGNRSFVKVLDFGTGSFTNDLILNQDHLNKTNEIIGTPAYSAPEQLKGEPITTKSDLYAWGLIILECLTGRPVIYGDNASEIFQKHLDITPIPIPSFIAFHPIAKLLKGVLQKNTSARTLTTLQVAEAYFKLNFNTITGRIQSKRAIPVSEDSRTQTNQLAWKTPHSEKKLLTVLCVKLNLQATEDSNFLLTSEILETILKDQLQFCKDIGIGFGAYISGMIADTIVMYFGYPQIQSNDARKAGRTALELISQVQKRNIFLKARYKAEIEIRITINSGTILIKHKNEPEGTVINNAFNLLFNTQPGTILVGDITKKLLDPFLEFEPLSNQGNFTTNKSSPVYLLQGEKHLEAFSNLGISNIDQKIIGRQSQLALLKDTWNKIEKEKGKSTLIKGPAGIGKSKIISEEKKRLTKKGYIVRECHCQPEYQNSALHPFFELFKQDIGIQETRRITPKLEAILKKIDCDLQKVIPVLCLWFSIPIGHGYTISEISSTEQKEILFDTLEKLILNIDKEKKFLLIIEDLHWVDPTSLDFIDRLIQNIFNADYFLILTSRPKFNFEIQSSNFDLIELKSLEKNNTKELIKTILKNEEIAPDVIKYIADRTDGIPLFINDLTQMLLDKNYLIKENNVYKLSDTIEKAQVPVTLEGLLNTQLDTIGYARETAQLASVIGREFDYSLLKEASINEESTIQQHLEILLESKLIYLKRNVQNNIYIFRHSLLKDAAYNRMVLAQKKELHFQIAKAFESIYSKKIETVSNLIANHYEKAQAFDKAIHYYEKAGDEAIRKSAFEEASLFFDKGLTIIDILITENELLWKPVKLRLLVQNSIALKPIKGWTHAAVISLYNQAHKIGLELKEYKTIAPVTFGLWVKHLLFVELNDALRFAKSYFNTASELNEIAMILEAKISMCNTYFWMGNIEKSLALADEVFNDFDTTIHKDNIHKYGQDPRAFAYLFKALSLNIMGNDVSQLTNEALSWAKSLNHPFTEAITLQTIAWIHFQNKNIEEGKKTCDLLKNICNEYGFKLYLAVAHLFSVPYYIKNKDFKKAYEELNTGYNELLVKDNIIAFHSVYCLFKSQIELGLKALLKYQLLKKINYLLIKLTKKPINYGLHSKQKTTCSTSKWLLLFCQWWRWITNFWA